MATTRTATPKPDGDAPTRTACHCRAAVNEVTIASGNHRGVRVFVDIDRDPNGPFVAALVRPGVWGVRLAAAGEAGHRFRPHWSTCPDPGRFRSVALSVAPDTFRPTADRRSFSDRSGPCARCRTIHPYHYGPGPASPLCDECLTRIGRRPIAPQVGGA